MARLNKGTPSVLTHEGAPADKITPVQALRRSIMSCLLWEKEFYEHGEEISDRIISLAHQVSVADLVSIAYNARHKAHLRHAPLLLLSVLAERATGEIWAGVTSSAIENTISRVDEMGELLAVHARRHGLSTSHPKFRRTISAQMKKGLASVFNKFDAYQLSKYNGSNQSIKLKDLMRLVHPVPGEDRVALHQKILDGTLESADTWENALSNTPVREHKAQWERLLGESRLGYLAVLRNLRNMEKVGVDPDAIRRAILARRGAHNVLPFRYVAAARAAPYFEKELDEALLASLKDAPSLEGLTVYLVDVSGSMNARLSKKSDMTRMIAAATLASVVPGDRRVMTFSERLVQVPPRMGMAGVDAIIGSQPHSGTYLGKAVRVVQELSNARLIVITDEQSHDPVPNAVHSRSYMINVASSENGVSYRGGWQHIDGFSENTVRWIMETEAYRTKERNK